jgi:hypothetical protein
MNSILTRPFFYALISILLQSSLAWTADEQIDPSKMGTTVMQDEVTEALDYEERAHISKDYQRGNNLIYDCSGQYWACVNEPSFDLCTEKRNSVEKSKSFTFLPCAPIKKFAKREECLKEQYKQQHHNKKLAFCWNEKNLLR